MNPLLQRISVDPNICFGKPCIRGTRIWVSLILDFLADGMSIDQVIAEYPQLTEEDIRAAVAYGAEMSRERYVDICSNLTCYSRSEAKAKGNTNSSKRKLRSCMQSMMSYLLIVIRPG